MRWHCMLARQTQMSPNHNQLGNNLIKWQIKTRISHISKMARHMQNSKKKLRKKIWKKFAKFQALIHCLNIGNKCYICVLHMERCIYFHVARSFHARTSLLVDLCALSVLQMRWNIVWDKSEIFASDRAVAWRMLHSTLFK